MISTLPSSTTRHGTAAPTSPRSQLAAFVFALAAVVAVLGALAFPTPTRAAAGDLVESFGQSGRATVGFDRGPSSYCCIAEVAGGKTLVAGSNTFGLFGRPSSVLVARYLPDGTLDTSFGTDGQQVTAFSLGLANVTSLLVRPDGGFYVVGDERSDELLIARYTADGQLDTSFDGDGRAQVDVDCQLSIGAVLQPDGKLVAVCNNFGFSAKLVRLLDDGTLDPTFGTGGVRPLNSDIEPADLTLDPDGNLLISGSIRVPGDTFRLDLAIARFKANGDLDRGFGTDGLFTRSLEEFGQENLETIVVQPNGTIVAAGTNVVLRLASDGQLDASFDGDGLRTGLGELRDVTVGSTGAVTVTGPDGTTDVHAVRLTAAGVPDTTFSGDGRATISGGGQWPATAHVVLDSGAIRIAGGTDGNADAPSLSAQAAVVGFTRGGAVDASWGTDGLANTTFAGSDAASEVLIDSAGRIVTIGDAGQDGTIGVTRHSADGALDPTFSADGRTTVRPGPTVNVTPRGAVDSQDRTIVATSTGKGFTDRIAVSRLSVDGSVDTSFGVGGTVGLLNGSAPGAIAVLPDDRIVVATNGQVGLLKADGSLDASFGGDGVAETAVAAKAIALQSDGKIVLVGGDYFTATFDAVRLNADGTVDETFGAGSPVRVPAPSGNSYAMDVAIEPNGRLVLVGGNAVSGSIVVLRLSATGSPEPVFAAAPVRGVQGTGVIVQPDGKIVISAGAPNRDNPLPANFALVRYNADGSLDSTFADDGATTAPFDGTIGGASATALAMTTSGDLLAAGSAAFGDTADVALALFDEGEAATPSPTPTEEPTSTPAPDPTSSPTVDPTSTPSPSASPSPSSTPPVPAQTVPPQRPSGPDAPTSTATPSPPKSKDPKPSCTAPRVRGLSLKKAKRRLRRAGCKVGRVTRPRNVRKRQQLIVANQRQRGSKVRLRLKVAR